MTYITIMDNREVELHDVKPLDFKSFGLSTAAADEVEGQLEGFGYRACTCNGQVYKVDDCYSDDALLIDDTIEGLIDAAIDYRLELISEAENDYSDIDDLKQGLKLMQDAYSSICGI